MTGVKTSKAKYTNEFAILIGNRIILRVYEEKITTLNIARVYTLAVQSNRGVIKIKARPRRI